jgi:hypothetical protein
LPEVGDLVRKRGKKQKRDGEDRYSAVPDSVVLSAMGAGKFLAEQLSERSEATDQREDRAGGEQLAEQGEMNLAEIPPGAYPKDGGCRATCGAR